MLILFLLLGSFISTRPQMVALAGSGSSMLFEMKNGSSGIGRNDGLYQEDCSDDTYESDNNYSAANLISTDGKLQYHVNTPPTDEDWVKFNASAGDQYEIRTQLTNDINESDTAANDTYLYLYGTDGITQLTYNDDVGWTTWYNGYYYYRESIISWTAPANGTYYVREYQWGPMDVHHYTIRDCHTYNLWVVDLTTTLITTSASVASAIVGTPVTAGDSATLTSGNNPTGSVTFTLYSDATCTTAVPGMSGSGTISGNSASWSKSWTPTTPGTYYWTASYPGDANNSAYTTSCGAGNEEIVVNQASPTISTTASPASVIVETAITAGDSATLNSAYNPSGSVTFTLYSDASCTTPVSDMSGSGTISGNSASWSKSWTPPMPGTYYWIASYPGDANNDDYTTTCSAANEQITVNKASPTITTTLSRSSITVGDTVHDSARLSGATSDAGGSVTYTVYSNNTCTLNAQNAGTLTVTNGSVPDSSPITFNTAGSYNWQAVYSGDDNNQIAKSNCANELLTVNQVSPSLTTSASPASVIIGTPVMAGDSATLTSGNNPTGSVTFTLYSDAACTTPVPGMSGSGAIAGGSASWSPSTSWTPTTPGTYYWIAIYPGDANNRPYTTTCGAANEEIVVDRASPTITTSASPASATVGTAAPAGDSATLTSGYNPSGSVTFTLYSDAACTTAVDDISGSSTISGGLASWSKSWMPTTPGTYYWIASYPGDTNNDAYTTTCGATNEEITTGKASPSITTTASPASGTVGTQASTGDSATFTGSYNPSGSVTFALYSDTGCKTAVSGMSGSGTISGGSASWSTNWTPPSPGTYYWIASYPGDDNNHAYTTACGAVNENIVIPAIGIAKRVVTITQASAGTYDAILELLVENYGDVPLTNLQVVDNLATTFPPPTTFTVQSLTSTDFTVNWPAYNGSSNTNLLNGTDSLAVKPVVKASGKLTLVVRVIPNLAGPFNNTATATANDSLGATVRDLSQDGTNPDPDGDGNPTNNNDPTPISFGPSLFDPPFGVKTVDSAGEPLLKWSVIWINDMNLVGVKNDSHDPIPVGSSFTPDAVNSGHAVPVGAPPGSTSMGVACTAGASILTVTDLCYYEGPTVDNPRGQIIWAGTIGPDFGVRDPALAVNAIHITFSLTAANGVTSIQNQATIDTDLNGNGVVTDPGEQNLMSASASWTARTLTVLPLTGFAPGVVTALPDLSVYYSDLGSLWLEIPRLWVQMPIVGVAFGQDGWDVSWLGNDAGWLNGTAYPTWSGNSVITGHVYGADGLPGPFVNLTNLVWGDQVIIHFGGQRYIYVVRTNEVISPTDTSIFSHKNYPWLTLLTCKDYNAKTNTYAHRVAVGAVLIRIEADPPTDAAATDHQR